MNPPFATRTSPSQFPTSLLFIPPIPKPKPSHFIISATKPKLNPQSIQTTTLIPIQNLKTKTKKIQDLAQRFKDGRTTFETITDFNHLFMGLVLENQLDLAYKLYSSLPTQYNNFSPNTFTFSILIHFHCKRNDPMEAKRVLIHMIENGFDPPKVKTFTQLINSFCKKGRLKHAFEVFEIMGKAKCDPTINTYNCLLKGLCYVGRVEEAYELLNKIKKKSCDLKPDVYSFTAVMDGFCKVGRSDEALELLNEAIEMGLAPSIVTYNTLFNGYFKEGRPKDGFVLLKEMKERNCKPDYVSYSTLLHGLLQWGEVRDGVRVYNEMLDKGFDVDVRMMNTLLRGLCRRSRKEKMFLKDAYQLFDEMSERGVAIDPCARELVVEAFCNGNEVDRAFVSLCEMMAMGLCPKTFTLDSVVRGLCVEGKVEKVMLVLVLVCRGRRCGMMDGGTFDVLINEMNRQGLVKRASSAYCVALKNGVNPLRKLV